MHLKCDGPDMFSAHKKCRSSVAVAVEEVKDKRQQSSGVETTATRRCDAEESEEFMTQKPWASSI